VPHKRITTRRGRTSFVLIAIALLVFASLGIYVFVTPYFKKPPVLEVTVLNQLNQPVTGASVQGFMLLPPTVGAGYANVFDGIIGTNGAYGILDTSAIQTIAKSWIAYQGKRLTGESSPNILVFVTYNSTNGFYFKETSIELTAIQLLAGVHYNAVCSINLGAAPQTTPSQLSHAKSPAVNDLAFPMSAVNNITSQPVKCSGHPCYDRFYVNSTFWLSNWSDSVQIPLIWMSVQGGAYGEFNAVIKQYSSNIYYNFNTGCAHMNTPDNVSSYDPGGSVWSSGLYYLSNAEDVNPSLRTNAFQFMNACQVQISDCITLLQEPTAGNRRT